MRRRRRTVRGDEGAEEGVSCRGNVGLGGWRQQAGKMAGGQDAGHGRNWSVRSREVGEEMGDPPLLTADVVSKAAVIVAFLG
jgi:hypothetical protein